MPVAMARTFLTVPPISTPMTSERRIDAQGASVQGVGHYIAESGATGHRQRGRQPARHLEREARAGNRSAASVRLRPLFGDHLVCQPMVDFFQALAQPGDGAGERRSGQCAGNSRARPGSAWQRGSGHRAACSIAASRSAETTSERRQGDAGKVAHVDARRGDLARPLAITRVQHHRVAGAGRASNRSAPRPCAEHRDIHRTLGVGCAVARRDLRGGRRLPRSLLRQCGHALLIESFEVDLGQVDRRQAGAADQVGDVRAQVGIDDPGADDAQDRPASARPGCCAFRRCRPACPRRETGPCP